MSRGGLTGSRIRERRMMSGLRQAELARGVGISASYLNLIEHNRRSIGGKLLLDIAAALGVEPVHLTEGAEAALTSSLREAAAARPAAGAELDRTEELAGRLTGWAQLIRDQHHRIGDLERSVEVLTDRLAHDPLLAASMHEVLSTVTAIRASASILVETEGLEPEWRDRFHRNIHEESARLAQGAQRLVSELDAADRADRAGMAGQMPQDLVDAFFEARGYHMATLEDGGDVEPLLEEAGPEAAGPGLLRAMLLQYRDDALALPLPRLLEAASDPGPLLDPSRLAAELGCGTALVMRRLACLPEEAGARLGGPFGLIVSDVSGTVLFRKVPPNFPMPRFGSACPLLPLFEAVQQPLTPIRAHLAFAGRGNSSFVAHAVVDPQGPPMVGRAPLLRPHMLLQTDVTEPAAPQLVGPSCRICPKAGCPARRERSIMDRGA
ncbi:helix-turn-helix domain-containing protein [Pseudooceanicola sp. C21-150M6]|uniref:helix-turn-helix domain-containing protein n=1 Tax=Pseudooceanicola sp. C21-150M6 TaxID=3434355 RepID=UPI003D7F9DA0